MEASHPHLFLSGAGGPEDECEAVVPPGTARRRPRPTRFSFDGWTKSKTRHYTTAYATDASIAWTLYDTRQVRSVCKRARFCIKGSLPSDSIKELLTIYNNAQAPPAEATQAEIDEWRWKAAQFDRKVRICGAQAEGSPYERRALRGHIAGLTAK